MHALDDTLERGERITATTSQTGKVDRSGPRLTFRERSTIVDWSVYNNCGASKCGCMVFGRMWAKHSTMATPGPREL